ncbi:hypothetical protein DCS_01008 [Drechmeria coniospora]|uniref:Cytochrome P450 n=1 Tax=Drechmeria coniospora TaxID=98403 RepID=A0A151GRY9_DRECN|nr:hypothetical protein DCS_01008 [Drechmeria coniospora]KYK59874.1 hypothetical protein DCS_01008 [Drechmeria coniospora]
MAAKDLVLSISWAQFASIAFVIWALYAVTVAIRRLWISPIAHIPGPKLAALSQYYEFFYDIILGGQYTFRIIEMHKKYGGIVRINPWEVHVADCDFHSELYSTKPRDKWAFYAKQFGAPHCALATLDHYHHKLRRSALNPFFSTQSVRNLQPVLDERVNALLEALERCATRQRGRPLNVMYPFSAFSNDVINEYAFARSDHLIEEPDFGAEVTDNLLTGTHMGMFVKHMSWALRLVSSLPESFSGCWVPGWGGFLKMKKDIVDQICEIKASENTAKWQLDVSHPTIFHEMLSSKLLPAEEKTPTRLAQEGQILVQGGTLTTSWTLTMAIFHLLHQPDKLRRLRDELFEAMPEPDEAVPLARLEKLPYLRAVVKEALRHNIGTSGRLPRIAPHEVLAWTDPKTGKRWTIPPGSVVSMSPFLLMSNDDVFPDAVGFHPERWLEGAGEGLEKYLIQVFGGGTRICLGMALAHAELHLLLAKLFRRWGGGGRVGETTDGDRRPGDVGVLKIFETTARDCQMASDYFVPIPYKGSKGVRVVMELN